jgi:phospholipase D1/2
MIIEDSEMIPSYMNGKDYKASKFAHTLRMQLWKEHLGLLDFDDWSGLLNSDSKSQHGNEVEKLNIPQSNPYPPSPSPTPPPVLPPLPFSSNEDEIKKIEQDEPVKMLDRASRTFSFYDNYKPNKQRHDAMALDPLSDKFYNNIWVKTAETNTRVYRKLFKCVPDDTVHTYEQHRKFIPDPNKVKYGHVADLDTPEVEIEEQLDKVKGHLVMFPTDYLKDENLVGSNLMETVTPLIIFT